MLIYLFHLIFILSTEVTTANTNNNETTAAPRIPAILPAINFQMNAHEFQMYGAFHV